MSSKDRNKDGLKGVNFPNYFKNLSKSTAYMIDDILSESIPESYNSFKAAANVPKKAATAFKNINSNVNQIDRNVKQSKVYRDVQTVLKNAKEDFKSGNLYNKKRKEKNDTFGFDFDDNSDNSSSSLSFDFLESSVDGIGSALRQQSNVTITMASAQIANANKNNVVNQVMSTRFHEEILESHRSINSNISTLIEFTNDVMRPAIDAQLQFFNDSIEEQRKISSLLLEIKDIHTEVNKNELSANSYNSNYQPESVNYDGTLNINNYLKNSFSNAKGMVDPFLMMMTLNSSLSGRSAIQSFGDSPISNLMKFGIKGLIPGLVKNSLKDFNTSFTNVGSAALLKANGLFDELNPFVGTILKELFGFSNKKTGINISAYNKEKMPFNGITNRAITNVIPSLLSKIYTSIEGINDNLIVDYENGGRLVWQSEKEKEFKEQKNEAGLFALYNFEEAMKKKMDAFEFDNDTQKRLDENFKEFLMHLRDSNKIFDVNNTKYMEDFNSKFPEFGNFYASIFKSLDRKDQNKLASQQLAASLQYQDELRRMEEESGTSGYAQIEILKGNKKNKETFSEFNKRYTQTAQYKRELQNAKEKYGALGFKKVYEKIQNEYTKSLAEKENKVNNVEKKQYKRSEEILESIRRTLVQGIIVFPNSPFNSPNDLPKHISSRLIDLDNTIAEEKRLKDKKTEKEMRKMQQSSLLSNGAVTANGINVNQLSDDDIAKVINEYNNKEKEDKKGFKTGFSSVDSALGAAASSRAGQSATRLFNAFNTVKGFIENPFSTVVKLTQKFDNGLFRVIYGDNGRDNGKGLIANLIDGFFEKWDAVKNTVKDKVGKGINFVKKQWGKTNIGGDVNDKVKGYIDSTKKFLTTDEEIGFKAGLTEVTNDIKNHMTDVFSDVKDTTLDVFDHFRTTIFGKNDKKGDNYSLALTNLNDAYKPYLSDGIIGAGTGALASIFMPGGPLLWGSISGLMNMSRRTGDLQNFLFGKEDENGNRTGNLIPKQFTDKLKSIGFDKSKTNKLIAGGLIGGAVGLLPSIAFGPVAGGLLGVGTQFISASSGLQEMLFGKKDENGEFQGSKLLKKELIQKFPHMKKMGTIGAMAGFFLPGGPVVGSILGAGLAYVKDTDAFNRFLWGDYDKETKTGKRGLFGTMGNWFKEEIGSYFGNFFKRQISKSMATISKSIISPFKHLAKPLQKQFSYIGDSIKNFVSDSLGKAKKSIFSFLNTILLKPLKGLFTKVLGGGIFKMARGAANVFGGLMDMGTDTLVKSQVKKGLWTAEEYYEYQMSRANDKQKANEKIKNADAEYYNNESLRKGREQERIRETKLYKENQEWRQSYEKGFNDYLKNSDGYKSLLEQREQAISDTRYNPLFTSKEKRMDLNAQRAQRMFDLKKAEELYIQSLRKRFDEENSEKFEQDRIQRRSNIEQQARQNITNSYEAKEILSQHDKALSTGNQEEVNRLKSELDKLYQNELNNLGYHYTDKDYDKNRKINSLEFRKKDKSANNVNAVETVTSKPESNQLETVENVVDTYSDSVKIGIIDGFKNTTSEIIETFAAAAGTMKNNVVNAFNKPNDSETENQPKNVADSKKISSTANNENNTSTPTTITGFQDKLIGSDFKEQQEEFNRERTVNLLEDIRNASQKTAENTEEMGALGGASDKKGSLGSLLGSLAGLIPGLGSVLKIAGTTFRTVKSIIKGGKSLFNLGKKGFNLLKTSEGRKKIGSKLLGKVGSTAKTVENAGAAIAYANTGKDLFRIFTGDWEDKKDALGDIASQWTTSGGIKEIKNRIIPLSKKINDSFIGKGLKNLTEKISTKTSVGRAAANFGENLAQTSGVQFLKNSAKTATNAVEKGKLTVIEWIEKMIASPKLQKVLKPIAPALKKAAPKLSANLAKAGGKAMAYVTPVGWALVANDVFTGMTDYRNILQLASDSEYNATMSLVCGAVRAINNFVTMGVIPEKSIAQLILSFTNVRGEMEEQQAKLKSDAEAAGFDDVDTFNSIENTTFWGSIFAKVPIVGKTKRKKIAKYIEGLNQELEAAQAEGNTQQVQKIQDSIEKAQVYYNDTKESWWESVGSAVSNFASKAGSWLSKLWPFGKGGATSETEKQLNKIENSSMSKGGAQKHEEENPSKKPIPKVESISTSRIRNEEVGMGGAKSPSSTKYVKPISDDFNAPLTSKYGWRTWSDGTKEWHNGVDYGVPVGTPIQSIADGKVTISQDGYNDGWGNYVRIQHDNGQESLYAHQSKRKVEVGDRVKAGQIIGESGNTGRSTGPHLHFGLYKDSGKKFDNGTGNGSDIDPQPVIDGKSMDSVTSATSSANQSTNGTDYSAEGTQGSGIASKFANLLSATQEFMSAKIFGQPYEPNKDGTTSSSAAENTSTSTVSQRAKNYKGELVDFSSTPEKQRNFFNTIQGDAFQNYVDYGILPSVTLAQAAWESGWGTSGLAKEGKALFGIKPGSNWTGKVYTGKTVEYYDGKTPTTIVDGFRAYNNWGESVKDHGEFLNKDRYVNVVNAADYKSATSALQQAGYATDPVYPSNLNKIINTYDLTRADKLVGRGGAKAEDVAMSDANAKQERIDEVKEAIDEMNIKPETHFGQGGMKSESANIPLDKMSESIDKINSTLTNYQSDMSDSINRTLDAEYYVNQQITSGSNWDKLMTILADISSSAKIIAANTIEIAENTENMTVKLDVDGINTENDDNKSLSVNKQNTQNVRNIFLGKADQARQQTTNAIHLQVQKMALGN